MSCHVILICTNLSSFDPIICNSVGESHLHPVYMTYLHSNKISLLNFAVNFKIFLKIKRVNPK